MSPLMDAREVAELLQCAERTVQDHAREGRLPAVKFGDGWMFPTEALLRAVNRIAEEDAAKRVQPVAPKAVRVAALQPKRSRPNLSLLA